jgi:hypothetical protein
LAIQFAFAVRRGRSGNRSGDAWLRRLGSILPASPAPTAATPAATACAIIIGTGLAPTFPGCAGGGASGFVAVILLIRVVHDRFVGNVVVVFLILEDLVGQSLNQGRPPNGDNLVGDVREALNQMLRLAKAVVDGDADEHAMALHQPGQALALVIEDIERDFLRGLEHQIATAVEGFDLHRP